MNPSKPLTMENSIPQCQVCNQVYRDDFVFDAKGRVVAVASANPVLRANEEVREVIKELLG
jgi:peroxiredoxin